MLLFTELTGKTYLKFYYEESSELGYVLEASLLSLFFGIFLLYRVNLYNTNPMNKSQGILLLKGIAASPGQAEGIARVILPSASFADFKENEILITTLTDPTMVHAMIKAAAIVTDIGGIISHPAILSREMGIPCVVNAKNATKIIKDGSRVSVNGTTGEVHVLD